MTRVEVIDINQVSFFRSQGYALEGVILTDTSENTREGINPNYYLVRLDSGQTRWLRHEMVKVL